MIKEGISQQQSRRMIQWNNATACELLTIGERNTRWITIWNRIMGVPKSDHRRSSAVDRQSTATQARKAPRRVSKCSMPRTILIRLNGGVGEPGAGPTIWLAIYGKTISAARRARLGTGRSSWLTVSYELVLDFWNTSKATNSLLCIKKFMSITWPVTNSTDALRLRLVIPNTILQPVSPRSNLAIIARAWNPSLSWYALRTWGKSPKLKSQSLREMWI